MERRVKVAKKRLKRSRTRNTVMTELIQNVNKIFLFLLLAFHGSVYILFLPLLRNKNQLLNEVCRSLAIVIRNHACQCVHARVPCEPYHDQYHSDKHVKITVNNLAKF